MCRHFAGWRLRLTRPTGYTGDLASRARQALRRRAIYRRHTRHFAGWRLRLTRPGFVRPVTHLPTCATETAGAGGLKIAETFPEGRGSPHGCGLRAVFCRDAASARPAACRISRRYHAVAILLAGARGTGAAATGRPCALLRHTRQNAEDQPGAQSAGINIEVVALPNVVVLPHIVRTGTFPVVPLFRRVAAAPTRPTGSTGDLCFPCPASAAPEGNLSAPYPAYNDCRAILLGRRLNPARRRCRQTPAAPDASWHWPPAARSTAQSA